MRAHMQPRRLVSALVSALAIAIVAIGCAVVEPAADTSTTSLAIEADAIETDTDVVPPMDDECGAITLQEVFEAGVEDVGTSSHDVPPPGSGNCSCWFDWQCRGTDCDGHGRAWRIECCTCSNGSYGCSSHWEATQNCC